MAKEKLPPEMDLSPGFMLRDKILLACLVALLLLVGVTMCAMPAGAHGEWGWMQKYSNATGTNCCDQTDAAVLSRDVANAATIGTVVMAPFPSGPLPVVVNIIHATEDREGRPWITKYGCLFRAFSG